MQQLVVVYGNTIIGPFQQKCRHQAEVVINQIRARQKTKKERAKRLKIEIMIDPSLWHCLEATSAD
jgi:hypothetical protein